MRARIAFLLALLPSVVSAQASVNSMRVANRYLLNCYAPTFGDLPASPTPGEGALCFVDADDAVYMYSDSTWTSLGGGGGAPTNAEYIVGAAHGSLSAERVCTDTASIDCDMGTAGQAKFNVLPAGVDHGALGGLSDDDHSQYALLAGRSGGQTLSGGSGSAEGFSLYANASDDYPRLALTWAGGVNPTFSLSTDATLKTSINCDDGFGCTFHVDTGNVWQFTEGASTPIAQIDNTGHAAFENYLGLGSSALSTATQSCMWVDTDRLFGDKDCDGTKDAGEEYLDEAAGGGGGDAISVNSSAATDADFADGDIDWTLNTGTTPDTITATVACSGCIDATDLATDSVAAAEIAADAVGEPELKAVNAPTDEYVLTYETTTGDFEWQPEGTTSGAPYSQYDPNRPPASCAKCEEYTNDAENGTLTWTAAGNADVTKSYALDSIRFVATGDSTAIDRYIYTTAAPASGDWVLTTKVHFNFAQSGVPMCGLSVIHAGTQASPTNLSQLIVFRSTTQANLIYQTATSLTSATADVSAAINYAAHPSVNRTVWLQFRYSDSGDTLRGCFSENGFFADTDSAQFCATRTSVTAATYFGFLVDELANNSSAVDTDCTFELIRLRTDGTGTSAPFPPGE